MRLFRYNYFVIIIWTILIYDHQSVCSAFTHNNNETIPAIPITKTKIPTTIITAASSSSSTTASPSPPIVVKLIKNSSVRSSAYNLWPRSLTNPHDNDEYVTHQRQQCSNTRNWSSCVKYKAAKLIWQLATNSFHLFPHEYGREFRDAKQTFRLIQLDEPSNMILFPEARSNVEGDNVSTSLLKFVKRALEVFGQNHGLQITLPNSSGIRVTQITDLESRGHKEKKKIKWTIILQLITLMKIAHLKVTLVNMLLLTIGLNALIVLGVAWIVNYLKTKTLCKIHPEFIYSHSHSHAYDNDPHEYSQFMGNDAYSHGHGGGGFGGGPSFSNHAYVSHDTSGYGKDWSSQRKAYHGHNYLDTISKRLK